MYILIFTERTKTVDT